VKASVTLDHGMTFLGTADTGFTVQMDAKPSVGGDNNGFRPMELLLVGLGGCTAMDVISILRKKKQEVTSLEVKLEAQQSDEHPHVFTHINVKYIVRGHNVDEKAVARSIELSVTKYCPAHGMLAKSATIENSYEIFEEEREVAND
jgi:putative redox protein